MNDYTYTIPTNSITGEPSITIVLRSDGAYIPTDPANSDYQAYLAYVANGNKAPAPSDTIAPAQPDEVAPSEGTTNVS